MGEQENMLQIHRSSWLGKNVCVIRLTGREMQVLDLIKQGLLYKEIAKELGVTDRAIEFHASKLLKIFNVADRYELEMILKRNDQTNNFLNSSRN